MSLRTQNRVRIENNNLKRVAIIVAHPDDETLWAGGTILCNPLWQKFIACLCRRNDKDRAPSFFKTLQILGSDGTMGDLDDGPEQEPLDENELEHTILQLLPSENFDLIISHNPDGEYTRHLRHEETGKAVIKLWNAGKIIAKELWTFAYEDGDKKYFPRAIRNADICNDLTEKIWLKKYRIVTETYGFDKNSWEAETTPKSESFWQFTNPDDGQKWLKQF